MRTSITAICILFTLALAAKTPVPVTRIDAPLRIDGVLEDAWLSVDPLPQPVEYVPNEGETPTQATDVRLAYDYRWFYISFVAWCDPDELKLTVAPRSGWGSDDQVAFAIDPYNRDRASCIFNFNARGNPKDWLWSVSGTSDMNWDIPLKSAGRIYSDRYVVEAAIPFKSISFDDSKQVQDWGFYYFRKDEQYNEQSVWPPRSQSIENLLTQAGVLHGLEGIKAGGRTEVVPYAFGSSIKDENGDWESDGDIGVDVETAVTSQVQVSATINPDYSQIEADAFNIDVNRRDPQWLSEKRPFFTRGADFFNTDMLDLLYTRHVVNPVAGVKVSGKFTNSNVGLITSLDEGLDHNRNDLYNIFRYSRNILSESTAGVMFTSVDDLDSDVWNRVGAVDMMLRLPPHIMVRTQAAGSAEQTTPGGDVEKGWAARGSFSYDNGNTSVDSWFSAYSENYEPGTGYLSPRNHDKLGMGGGSRHDLWNNVGVFEQVSVDGGIGSSSTLDLEIEEQDYWIGVEMDFTNRTNVDIDLKMNHNKHEWIDAATGAPMERMFSTNELCIRNSRYFNSKFDGWINFSLGNDPYYGDTGYDPGFEGWQCSADWGCNWRPHERVSLYTNGCYGQFYLAYKGDHKYDWATAYLKATFLLRRNIFLRTILQEQYVWMEYPRLGYDSYESVNATLNVLLTWQYRPLSNFYMGCNMIDFDEWEEMDDNMQWFAKVNYLWSL